MTSSLNILTESNSFPPNSSYSIINKVSHLKQLNAKDNKENIKNDDDDKWFQKLFVSDVNNRNNQLQGQKQQFIEIKRDVGNNRSTIRMLQQKDTKQNTKLTIKQSLQPKTLLLLNQEQQKHKQMSVKISNNQEQKINTTHFYRQKSKAQSSKYIYQMSILEFDSMESETIQQQPLNISDTLQFTVLNVKQIQTNRIDQICKTQQLKRNIKSIGKIKKNIQPNSSSITSKHVKTQQQYVPFYQQPSQSQLSCSQSLQEKLSQIFKSLDRKKKGQLNRYNCNDSILNQNIKIIMKPIIKDIDLNNKKYNKIQFIHEIMKILSNMEVNEINRIFCLEVINFQKQRKSLSQRKNIQNRYDQFKTFYRNKTIKKQTICQGTKHMKQNLASIRYPKNSSKTVKTNIYTAEPISHINTWKVLQNHYSIKHKPDLKQRFSNPTSSSYFSQTSPQLFLKPLIPQTHQIFNNKQPSSIQSSQNRIQKLSNKLDQYIRKNINPGFN